MQDSLKFTAAVLSFALFSLLIFVACVIYYIVQTKKIVSKNISLPPNYRIDTANLTPLNIVVTGSRELRNII